MEHPERIINGEDTVAICYGSVAWWLGKKVCSCVFFSRSSGSAQLPREQPRRPCDLREAALQSAGRLRNAEIFAIPHDAIQRFTPLAQTEEYYTHRWTVYVRGANNEDLRHVVSKVGCENDVAALVVSRSPADQSLAYNISQC